MDRRSERTGIGQDVVLRELALIGFSDMKNYVDFGPVGVTLKELSEMPENISRAIAEVSHNLNVEGGGTVKFKLYDKLNALVQLGRHLGMFTDRKVVNVENRRAGELSREELMAIAAGESDSSKKN